ncbi:MAG TPA: hypothetical protein VNG90_04845 [Candidatus Acidoferrum sp.]|nr:hypothetical protein [Candidatus Acidoferrum sp.]
MSSVFNQEIRVLQDWVQDLNEGYSARTDNFVEDVGKLGLSLVGQSFKEQHASLFSHRGQVSKQGARDFVTWLSDRLPVIRGGDWYQPTRAFVQFENWVIVQIGDWYIPMRASAHWSALRLWRSGLSDADRCIRVLPWYEFGVGDTTWSWEQSQILQNDPDLQRLVNDRPKTVRAVTWYDSNDPDQPSGSRAVSCFGSVAEALAFAILIEEAFFTKAFQRKPYTQLTRQAHVCLTSDPSDLRKALNSMLMVTDEETLAEALRQERYGWIIQPMCL